MTPYIRASIFDAGTSWVASVWRYDLPGARSLSSHAITRSAAIADASNMAGRQGWDLAGVEWVEVGKGEVME